MPTSTPLSRRSALAIMGSACSIPSFSSANSLGNLTKPPWIKHIGITRAKSHERVMSDLGYDFVEMSVSRHIKPFESDADFLQRKEVDFPKILPALGANNFAPKTMRLFGPDRDVEELIDWSEKAFIRASSLGMKFLVFGSGGTRSLPDGMSKRDGVKGFAEFIRAIAPFAEKTGITLGIEPLNYQETNFINTLVEGAEICELVKSPQVKITCDIYHALMNDEPVESVAEVGAHIGHVHVAEKQGRSAPGTHGEDLSPWYRAIEATGYAGTLSIECGWKDLPNQAGLALKTILLQAGGSYE